MNTIGKRLLSWLCVIAMVLSFVPVIDLGNLAVETRAVEETANEEETSTSTGPQVGTFDPWNHDGMAYCQACIDLGTAKENALVEWTEYTGQHGDTLFNPSGTSLFHFYLTSDLEYTTRYAIVTYEKICFNLNGYDIIPNTAETGVPTLSCTQRFNLFNTGDEATVWGNHNQSAGSGCVFNANGGKASATFNLFGNIILKSDATEVDDNPVVGIGANGGTINLRGATIDARGLTVQKYPSAVYLQGSINDNSTSDGKAVFNMYSGTIYGGNSVTTETRKDKDGGNGGAIRVGSLNAEGRGGNSTAGYYYRTYAGVATFNMYGGLIEGGVAEGNKGGGTFYVDGNTVNIYGGTINGGMAKRHTFAGVTQTDGTVKYGGNGDNYGGVFCVQARTPKDAENKSMAVVPGAVNISQTDAKIPTVINGFKDTETTKSTTSFGSVATLYPNCVINISGGTIRGGNTTGQAGILRAYQATVNLSGDAKLYAGWAEDSKTHGIWLVSSDCVIGDNVVVYGPAGASDSGNTIAVTPYSEIPSTLTLKGNATVKAESGASQNCIGVGWTNTGSETTFNPDNDLSSQLFIDNTWTGEAYVYLTKNTHESSEANSKGQYSTVMQEYSQKIANERYIIDQITAFCGSPDANGAYMTKLADYQYEPINATGSFSGKLYYKSATYRILGVDGQLRLASGILVDAEGDHWYAGIEEALAAYYASTEPCYIRLIDDSVVELDGRDLYVDTSSYTMNACGTGTVHPMNYNGDNYTKTLHPFKVTSEDVTVAQQVQNPINGNRYATLKVKETDGVRYYNSHRFEVKLTAVSLRAGQAGLYYKATYACDDTLAACVDSLGVALGVESIPTDLTSYEYLTEYKQAEVADKFKDHKLENVTSGSVFGIIKEDNEASLNAANLEQDIHAKAYLALNLDGEKVYLTSNESTWNMLTVLEKINVKFDGLEDIQKNELKKNVDVWKNWPGVNLTDTLSNVFAYTAQ